MLVLINHKKTGIDPAAHTRFLIAIYLIRSYRYRFFLKNTF